MHPSPTVEGPKCTTYLSSSGVCIGITQCPSLKRIRDFSVLRRSLCGFQGEEPKLCCPTSGDATGSGSRGDSVSNSNAGGNTGNEGTEANTSKPATPSSARPASRLSTPRPTSSTEGTSVATTRPVNRVVSGNRNDLTVPRQLPSCKHVYDRFFFCSHD